MDFVLALLVIAAAVAVAVTAMLLVRRRAPDGSYFSDGDRASGVFGVLATGFAILLGLFVFLAFTSYDDSKTGAESEALAVVQQFETAQFLPAAARSRLGGELICYGRSVIGQEWPRLRLVRTDRYDVSRTRAELQIGGADAPRPDRAPS